MKTVTNAQLAELIGGLEDKMIALSSVVAVLVAKVDAVQKTASDANGRQRDDHDMLLNIAKNQETCPARKAHSGGADGTDSPWDLARWGLRQYGVFAFLALVIVGLFALLLKANGVM